SVVPPTIRERIGTLDVARGAAVLGILLANISWFATPSLGSFLMTETPEPTAGAERWLELAQYAFVTAKFRSMLAILFGVGMYLQFVKRSQVAKAWPAGYFKRTGWLCVFGLVHGLLIWFGDILFLYSIGAFVACALVHLSEKAVRGIVKWVGGSALIVGAVLTLVVAGLTVFSSEWVGESTPTEGFPSADHELWAFSEGGYLDQLRYRSLMFALSSGTGLFFLLWLVPLMLLGWLLAKHDVLRKPGSHPAWKKMMGWGLGLGIPLNLTAFLWFGASDTTGTYLLAETAFGPILAVGYLAVLVRWAETGFLRPVLNALALVGRMAFSNYILQSLLCTFVFYSWGLGLFGQIELFGLYGIVAGVWAVNIAFSALWLRFFAMGPLEWLWRSLVEGRRLPIRNGRSLPEWPAVAAPLPDGLTSASVSQGSPADVLDGAQTDESRAEAPRFQV
ncbi:MAG: DUF418 domain-containing protein, partial [Fimbriimonadaceae bacterium]